MYVFWCLCSLALHLVASVSEHQRHWPLLHFLNPTLPNPLLCSNILSPPFPIWRSKFYFHLPLPLLPHCSTLGPLLCTGLAPPMLPFLFQISLR